MENYDEVGKFENIAENSDGSTQEKMGIYGDSVEASKNRMTAAVEEFTQDFNILGADGDDILKGWNNLLTYIIKNAKTLLAIFAGIVVYTKGIKAEGLKHLGQSLAVSAGSWGKKFGNIGANKSGFIGRVANGGNGVGAGSEILTQIQAQQSNVIYSTAMKQGAKMKLGGTAQLDRGASFLSGMDSEQLAAWNKLDEKTQKDLIKQHGAEGTEQQLIAALKDLTLAIRGETEDVEANKTANQGQSTPIKDKDGNIIGHTSPKISDKTAKRVDDVLTEGAEKATKIETEGAIKETNTEVTGGQQETNTEVTGAQQETTIELTAAERESLTKYIADSGIYKTDAGTVVGMSNSKPVNREMSKGANMSNLSGALVGGGGMAATMAASMWNSKVTDNDDTAESTVATVSNMAPMIGSMFGPWGLLAGSIVSIAGSIFNTRNKTDGELLKAAQEANEQLSDIKNNLDEDQKSLDSLETNETLFNTLLKGVNQTTGENVSLNDTEWQQYQTILSDVINAHDSLYAAYDEEGNLIAKNAGDIADLNGAMRESIEIMKDKIRQEKYNVANQTKDNKGKEYNLATSMQGNVLTTYNESGAGISAAEKKVDNSRTYDLYKQSVDSSIDTSDFDFSYVTYDFDSMSKEAKEIYNKYKQEYFDDAIFKRVATAEEVQILSDYLRPLKTNDYGQNVDVDKSTASRFRNYVKEYADYRIRAEKELKTLRSQQDAATRQKLSSELKSSMSYVLQGKEGFSDLSDSSQSFLLNEVFGKIQANPYKEEDGKRVVENGVKDDFNDMYKAYKEIAEKAVDWGKTENVYGMSVLSNFDQDKAIAFDDEQYEKYMLEMLQYAGADANKTRAILTGMGYTGFEGLIDKDGNWVDGVLDENDKLDLDELQEKLQSKREQNVKNIQKNEAFKNDDITFTDAITGKETTLLDSLTNEEIAALRKNLDNNAIKAVMDSSKSAEEKLVELRYELKKITMGDFASASEYLSIFSQQMNINVLDTEKLTEALHNAENDGVFGFTHLNSIAENFGITIDKLIDNIAILGDIDIFGRTSKSLSEVTAQFELIDKALSDIRDNGKITAENLEKLLKSSPELIHYIGQEYNSQSLQDVLENSQQFKMRKYAASLEYTLATSSEKLKEMSDQFITTNSNDEKVQAGTDNIHDTTLMFGNLNAMQQTMRKIYQMDKNGNILRDEKTGNVLLRDDVGQMKLRAGQTKSGDYTDDSWAKLIAENVFNIDTLTGSTDDVNKKLYDAMKARAKDIDPDMKIKSLGDGGLTQLLEMFRTNLLGNANYMAASEMAMNAQAEINSYQQILDMEDEMKAEAVSKYISDLDDAYSRGTISFETYEKSLSGITEASGASAEQLKELKEKLEDLKFDQLSAQFEKGAISGAKYRSELETLMSQNIMGSDDWKQFAEAYIGAYQQDIENFEKQFEFLQDDDYASQTSLIKSKQQTYGQKLAAIEAAGRAQYGADYNPDNDPAYLAAKEELMNSFKQLSEVLDTQYSDIKSNYDNGYIGIDEYIVSLNNLIDAEDASKEQIEAWTEELEDSTLKLAEMKFNEGTLSGEDYRRQLAEQMHDNDETSDDYQNAKEKYLSSYDTEMQMEAGRRSLLDEHDYEGKATSLAKERAIAEEQYAAYVAAGMQDSKGALDILQKQVDLKKEELENEKQLYEYRKQNAEEVLDAYNNILSYGIDELQNRQQDINDMYDDEISKLQDINDQKKRSIELTKLQQELENARKEKTRVYQAGVGFVYQENKAKVKEAKQNLENYLDETKIQDLQFAQKQQNELIQDEINRLQDIQKYINDIKSLASATASLMDLKKNGIVPQDMTIDQAIKQINNEAINGEDGRVASLGNSFEGFKEQYLLYDAKLQGFVDTYDDKIKDLAGWAKTYKSDEALVNKLKEDFASTVKPLTDDIPTIEDKLTKFLGDKDYAGWTADLATKFANALPKEEKVEGIKSTDLTAVTQALNAAKAKLEQANKLMSIYASARATTTDGTWGKNDQYHNVYDNPKNAISAGGLTWYKFYNTENDPNKKNPLYTLTYGKEGTYVNEDTQYWTFNQLKKMGVEGFYSSGIENGPVTYTGLAMLHGSPSNPEYVLNSEQAGTLLKNLSTMTISPYQAPKVDSYNNGGNSTVYQFNGDMNLPNVQRPDQFFDELLKQANVQFPTIKRNYR